jgi:GMP synthase (glutamine-hydrolysing)
VNLLILRTGHSHPDVVRRHGDYDRWFIDRMDGLGCRFTVHDVPERGVPAVRGFDGVLVTGTTASVLDGADWMRRLGEFLARAGEADSPSAPPVLAVCFAAQLAATAAGGTVRRNPLGWEIGTVRVRLTPEGRSDPLFADLPEEMDVQSTHQDEIAALPDRAVLLAGSARSAVQAFSLGPGLRAVQFHPEADAAIIRTLIGLRRGVLEEEERRLRGLDETGARRAVAQVAEGVHDSPWGRRLLSNWVDLFVRRRTTAPAA